MPLVWARRSGALNRRRSCIQAAPDWRDEMDGQRGHCRSEVTRLRDDRHRTVTALAPTSNTHAVAVGDPTLHKSFTAPKMAPE